MTGNYAQLDVLVELAKPGGLAFLHLGLTHAGERGEMFRQTLECAYVSFVLYPI